MGWGPGPTARLFGLFFRAKLCPFFLRILACRGSFFFSLQVWWRDGSGHWTEGTGLRALDWGYWTEGTGQFFFSPCRYGGRTALDAGLRVLDWGHWTEGTGLRVLDWGYWAEGTGLRKLDYGYYGLRELTTEWLWWSTWIEGLELNYKKKRLTVHGLRDLTFKDWGNWTTKWLNCSTWIEGPELHELRDLNCSWLIDLRALTILSDWSEVYTWTRTRLRRLTMDWGT